MPESTPTPAYTPPPVTGKDAGVLAKGKEVLSVLKNAAVEITQNPMVESGKDISDCVQSAVATAKSSGEAALAELGRPNNDTVAQPTPPSVVFESVPADFHYEKTVIVPGKFVFIYLPFEKQMLKGVCAAASVLNAVKYIDPTIVLNQDEMFCLYNNNQSEGADPQQMVGGIANLGFETDYIQPRKVKLETLLSKIQASLEDNRPLIACGDNHAVTLIGFNKSTKKITVWDQRGYGVDRADGRRAGMYDVDESTFCAKFYDVFIVRRADAKPSDANAARLQKMTGISDAFIKHTLVNSNSRQETISKFAQHAVPQLVKVAMRAGRTLLIPVGSDEIISIAPQENEKMEYTVLPSGKTNKARIDFVTKSVLDAGGVFYSSGKK